MSSRLFSLPSTDAQAVGQADVRDQILQRRACRVRLGDLDLLENEVEVGADEHRALTARGGIGHAAAGVVGGGGATATTGAVGAENTCSVTPCASV